MNRYRFSILILSTFLLSNLMIAGGSTYSRYGIGDIIRYGDSRLYAMGGVGVALIDDGFINGLNPAGLARISFTRFSGGFEYNRFSSKDYSGSTGYSTGSFQGLSFAIPISRENGIVLGFSSTPYSNVRYTIDYTYSDILIGSVKHQSFYGSGGLSKIDLGLSTSLLNNLHIGGRLNYLYGRTRQYQKSTYDNSELAETTMDHSIFYSGYNLTIGLIYEGVNELLSMPSLKDLTLGVVITTATKLQAKEQNIYSSIDSTFSTDFPAKLPLSIDLGVSYRHRDQFRLLGDLHFENWANGSIYDTEKSYLRNSLRAGVGIETIPSNNPDSFWLRNSYRAGLVMNSTYYSINGIGITEYLGSIGIGLPIGPDSKLNFAFQAGIRGSTENKLLKDSIFRFSLAISASEIWFLSFDEE